MPAPRDASTVIVARDSDAGIEVYLLRRSSRAPALPTPTFSPAERSTTATSRRRPGCAWPASGDPTNRPSPTRRFAKRTKSAACCFRSNRSPQDALRAARTRMLKHERSFNETLLDLNARLDAERHPLLLALDHAGGEPASVRRAFFRRARAGRSGRRTRRARDLRRPLGSARSTRSRRPSATKFR